MHFHRQFVVLSLATLAVAMSGCQGYVKKTDFDSAISELRANDQKQQQEIDNLTQQMERRMAGYDAKIAQMKGRVRVDAIAHFAFNESALRDEDKPLLDDFAKVISSNFPSALITVEGFADAAGSKAYNIRLGRARANAVRDYLVGTGGLSADRVRTVSYGEAENRQVLRSRWGDSGEPNRRVMLVVDSAGGQAAPGDG